MANLPSSICVIADIFGAQPLFSSADYITSAVVLMTLGKKESIIWSKLARRYSTPILPAPPIIVSIDMDLTCYGLLVEQAILTNTLEDSPWPDRYKEAMDLLNELASGSMALVSGSGTVIDASATAAGLSYVSGTEFDRTYWDGIGADDTFVDSDKFASRFP